MATEIKKSSQARLFRLKKAETKEKTPNWGKVNYLLEFHEHLSKDLDFLKYKVKFYEKVQEFKLTTQFVTDVEGKQHLIIFDKNFFSYVENTKRIYLDGTFRVVPRRCGKQLLTFMMSLRRKGKNTLIIKYVKN